MRPLLEGRAAPSYLRGRFRPKLERQSRCEIASSCLRGSLKTKSVCVSSRRIATEVDRLRRVDSALRPARHHPRKRMIQYSTALSEQKPRSLGVLDTRFRGHDDKRLRHVPDRHWSPGTGRLKKSGLPHFA
jgi:hypothetical protein